MHGSGHRGEGPAVAGRLIGRERELRALEAAIGDARQGRGQCVLISGEAGIGKTCIAEAATEAAVRQGMTAVWGRCWESGGAPAFWPWRQILRDCLQHPELASFHEHLGPAKSLLATEAPWMSAQRRDAEYARFALFEGVVAFLTAASRSQPLLLMVDDVHAADPDSLLLARFVAQSLRAAPILLIATYRNIATNHDPSDGLADLRREATLLELAGLSEAAVGELVNAVLGDAAVPVAGDLLHRDLVRSLWQLTQGNPLFVREIARALSSDGPVSKPPLDALGQVKLPEQVSDAIYRRTRPLSQATRAFLSAASVMGRDLDVRVLGSLPDPEWTTSALPRLVDEAVGAGILRPLPSSPFRFEFSHALVRDRLYADIEPSRRTALHAAVGGAILEIYGEDDADRAAEMAHHFAQAAAWGEADRALRFTLAAARRAVLLCAYDEAVRLWESALLLVPLITHDDARKNALRCEVLLGLGEALNDKGERTRAREIFGRAAQIARTLPSAERLAQAALGYGGGWLGASEVTRPESAPGAVLDEALAEMLREALAGGAAVSSALRARLSARLAVESYFASPREERARLADEALTTARRLDDPLTLASVLYDTTIATWGPENARERLDRCREFARLGQRAGHVGLELAGRGLALLTTLNLGDVDAWRAEQSTFRKRTEENPLPVLLWHLKIYNTMSALLGGELDRVEDLAMDAFHTGQLTQRPAIICWNMQLMALRREQGRLPELSDALGLFKAVAEQYPDLPHVSAAVAYLYHEMGELDEARQAFERVAGRGFDCLRGDLTWLTAMIELAEVCSGLGDRPRAALLYERLIPYASYNSIAAFGAVCGGSVARSLGALAAVLEHWDDSEEYFRSALERNAAFGAQLWVAHTAFDYARMLDARGRAGGAGVDVGILRNRAREQLDAASALAASLGMSALGQRCERLRPSLDSSPAAALQAANPEARIPRPFPVEAHSFRRQGDFWEIRYEGISIHMRHTTGLELLAQLLRQPGRAIHALELLGGAPVEGTASRHPNLEQTYVGRRAQRLGEADSMLLIDAQAKAQYKARLAELRAAAEEARDHGQALVAERLQEEIDALVAELGRAAGLGGRARRTGTLAERARVNATRAIATALRNIRQHHRALGEHFDRTIRTGTFCTYAPDPRLPITWTA